MESITKTREYLFLVADQVLMLQEKHLIDVVSQISKLRDLDLSAHGYLEIVIV